MNISNYKVSYIHTLFTHFCRDFKSVYDLRMIQKYEEILESDFVAAVLKNDIIITFIKVMMENFKYSLTVIIVEC